MKKKLFLSIVLITLSFSSLTYSASWLDSLADKLMNSIGADKLMDKVGEMENIIGSLENITKNLESFDMDELGASMMKSTFDIYKKYGADFIPSNYKNMSYQEIKNWYDDNKDKIETWSKTLSEEQIAEMEKEGRDKVVSQADPIMDEVNKLEKPLNELQNTLNETEPLLDNYINGYKNLYKVLQDKEKALELLSKYPEWNQIQEQLKEFAKAYAEGDRIEAFKILDRITGIISNSEAGKGWKIILENSNVINIGKYVSKILKTLVKFSGSNDLDKVSESQLEQVINDYLEQLRDKLDIKDNADTTAGILIKEKLEEYTRNTENLPKLAESLNELKDSTIGKFIQKQLTGNGKEALEDVMSKYSGVDKKTIRDTGLLDKIFDFASNFFVVK